VRIGIFSDVHGNVEALEVVLKALGDEKVDCIYCLGDLVGYGPDPDQCVEKVMEAADSVIMGNHDLVAIGQMSTSDFNTFARQAIDWTRGVLSSESIERLSKLPFLLVEADATWVHATPGAPDEWDYIISIVDAYYSFESMKTPLCFVGHSHVPIAYIQDKNGDIAICDETEITIEEDKKYIINVGSVGQPRDGDPRASYGILDVVKKRYRLNRVIYPIKTVQEKMQKVHLPRFLIARLSTGE